MSVRREGQGIVLILVASALAQAGIGRADPPGENGDRPPVKPSTERTLRLPETPYRYADPDLPAHFKTPIARSFDNTPADNPVTDAGATLGRVLFYDTRLSANNTVACASCHRQERAFVDPNRFSKGFDGRLTDRHAPSLVNLRFYPRGRFFWDERARSLEDQILRPIQSKVEMGQDLARLPDILGKDEHYPKLFAKAFGDSKVTNERLARAIAQFLRSMISYRSRYDEGLIKARVVRVDFDNFTGEENQGKTLFLERCAICHLPAGQAAHFFTNRPINNGLDGDFKQTDGGVGDISLNPAQLGLFKSPSLRNVELTGPYMHDGRFASLDEVIDHYSKGIKPHPNLDGRLRRPLDFSAKQRASLVAFLRTLSDTHFITDAKFSDPFQ
jgi:cytochrome c peroxidase